MSSVTTQPSLGEIRPCLEGALAGIASRTAAWRACSSCWAPTFTRCRRLSALPANRCRPRCSALDELLNAALATLNDFMGIRHAMVLMLDAVTQRLYTVAS